jgi:hypothetical protein
VLAHVKVLERPDFLRDKAGIDASFGAFPRANEPERQQHCARSSVLRK